MKCISVYFHPCSPIAEKFLQISNRMEFHWELHWHMYKHLTYIKYSIVDHHSSRCNCRTPSQKARVLKLAFFLLRNIQNSGWAENKNPFRSLRSVGVYRVLALSVNKPTSLYNHFIWLPLLLHIASNIIETLNTKKLLVICWRKKKKRDK